MLRLGKELPILKRLNKKSMWSDKLTSFSEDAFSFINKPGILYDRVIIDMPDPHNEAINKLYSREFYTMIQRRMSPDGILVTQSSSPFYTRRVFWCIENTLEEVFGKTMSYHTALPSFGIWGFNMAGNNLRIPENFDFNISTKAITSQTMLAAMQFDKDLQEVSTPINSIMEPKLYQLYIDDLRY